MISSAGRPRDSIWRQFAYFVAQARWLEAWNRPELRLVAKRLSALASPDGSSISRHDYSAVLAEMISRYGTQLMADFDLYCRCLGAFPGLVKITMLILAQEGKFSVPGEVPCASEDFELAPWEHDDFDLVEYEWYFDLATVRRILSAFPAGQQRVLSVSVPTIVSGAAAAGHQVTLLDRSPSLMHKHLGLHDEAAIAPAIVPWDLGKESYLDALPADVVVLDPPWSLEHYRAWLHTATSACVEGGLIMLPVPHLLTNRHMYHERAELLSILDRIGSVRIVPNALSYVTPSFERAVLEIDQLDHLTRWRRADLAIVRRDNTPWPFEFSQVSDLNWKYRRIRDRVVRTYGERPQGDGAALPVIEEAHPGNEFRLTSVSRNSLHSSNANLVTSGGRTAVVRHWGHLPQILDGLQDEADLVKTIDYELPEYPVGEKAELGRILDALLQR